MIDEKVRVEDFYQAVAELLKCEGHSYHVPYRKKTRWNNRNAGNGRYPGHGLVRYFGADNIHVALHTPPINGRFTSVQSVLDALKPV